VRVLLTHRRFVEPVKMVITYGGLHIRFHFSFFSLKDEYKIFAPHCGVSD
jgi:hypothetical protein